MKKATLSQAAKKTNKPAKSASTKTKAQIRAEMAANAAIIQGENGAEAFVPSTRPASEIISERIIFHEDGMGVDISGAITIEEIPVVLGYFSRHREGVNYIIGDLCNYAERTYGPKKYEAIVLATGLDLKTLQNIASVCRKTSPALRLLAPTYSHAASVSALPAAKATMLLEKSKKETLNVAKLRKLVKGESPVKTPKKKKAAKNGATPASEEPLTAEQTAENDAAIERADAIESYIRAKEFANLPASVLKTWAKILKPFAQAYEGLVKKGHAK